MLRIFTFLLATVFTTAAAQAGGMTPAPKEAKAHIIAPADGATVSSPFKVYFGLSGMGVAPAGVEKKNTGHHHLIINAPLPPMNEPIPANDNYRHFGGGQTEAMIDLPPGRHTLQLLVGDWTHVPHATPIMSEKITITVK